MPSKSKDALAASLLPLVDGKRVIILGMGREGQSTQKFLHDSFPELDVAISDRQQGEDYLISLKQADVIFISPGISPTLPEVVAALKRGAMLTSQTDIFFRVFSRQIIAVTGTKGKSTAASVISQVLASASKPTVMLGNIGSPAFDHLDEIETDTNIVYEVSSHQAQLVTVGPHIGVWLNVWREHQDYYPTMQTYIAAKRQLFAAQTIADFCLYNSADVVVTKAVIDLPVKKLGFSLNVNPEASVYVQNNQIMWRDGEGTMQPLLPADQIPLLGRHNIINVMPAILVAQILGLAKSTLVQALQSLTPVPGRLEKVATKNGIEFYDDALATIPEATIAALDALGGRVETLFVGGADRQQDFESLANRIAHSSVKNLIWFAPTGERIVQLVQRLNPGITAVPATSMPQAVGEASTRTHSGNIVLLSTASPSFGMFADYRDRSAQYVQAIAELR